MQYEDNFNDNYEDSGFFIYIVLLLVAVSLLIVCICLKMLSDANSRTAGREYSKTNPFFSEHRGSSSLLKGISSKSIMFRQLFLPKKNKKFNVPLARQSRVKKVATKSRIKATTQMKSFKTTKKNMWFKNVKVKSIVPVAQSPFSIIKSRRTDPNILLHNEEVFKSTKY